MEARVAVLASGGGTNLQALLDDPVTGPWIAVVLSDVPDAKALQRARDARVEVVVVDPADHADRGSYDAAVLAELQTRDVDAVVLAGFMRVVTPLLLEAYRGRMLNVHPSLLPSFPGAHAVADALAYGVKVTGVSVHLVEEEVDGGPIVLQEAVAVLPSDDWDSLEARIHDAEHRCLPMALRALVEGRLSVDGRHVWIEEAP